MLWHHNRIVQDINLLLSPKERREPRRKSQSISINRSSRVATTPLYLVRSAFLCIVLRVPIAETLIKSGSLVLFFCHCTFSTPTRPGSATSPHRLFPRRSFTASGLHLRASRFTTSRGAFGLSGIKYFFRWLHIARAKTFHYYLGIFFLPCPRLTARHRTVADAVCLRRFPLDALLCAGKKHLSPVFTRYFPFPRRGARFLP